MEQPFISFINPETSLNAKTEDTSNINIQDTPVTTAKEYLKNVIPGSLVDNVLYYIPTKLHYKFKDVLSLFIKNEISKDFLYYAEHIQYNANDLIMEATAEEMNICDDCREVMDIIQFPE